MASLLELFEQFTAEDIRSLGVLVPVPIHEPRSVDPRESTIPNLNDRCCACWREFKTGEETKRLPCGHKLHACDSCMRVLVPFKCTYNCSEEVLSPADLITSIHNEEDVIRSVALPPEANPPTLDVRSHDNPAVKLAVEYGYAHLREETNVFPSFACPGAGIPAIPSRAPIGGKIQHRKALIAPNAGLYVNQRMHGFVDHAQMLYPEWIEKVRPYSRADIKRYTDLGEGNISAITWFKFVNRRNWWYISNTTITDRTFARDAVDCQWLYLTDKDIRAMHVADPPRLQELCGMSRWWNGFRFHIDFVKEGFWRLETKCWVSSDDTSWRYLSYERFNSNFPRISQNILDLEIPVALGYPTPPTPFYHGVRMARLQRNDPDNPLLALLEKATFLETLIFVVLRYHSEMAFAGRLHYISPHAVAVIRENIADYELGLNIPTRQIIEAMASTHPIPPDLFNHIQFKLPSWALLESIPDSSFIWSLLPTSELDTNAQTKQYYEQGLGDEVTKAVLHNAARLKKKYGKFFRRHIHEQEYDSIPNLRKFIVQEFGKDCGMIQIGTLAERLSVRILGQSGPSDP